MTTIVITKIGCVVFRCWWAILKLNNGRCYMASKQFQNILLHVRNLNYDQLKKLRHEVESNISNNQVGQSISDHEETISNCPHCDSCALHRWGMTRQGIQRFKCKSCEKTFNALADSPLYRMRKPQKWIEYTKLLWDGVSLRKAAKILNITLRTSFRWRHTFIKAPARANPTELMGVIEADENFYLNLLKVKEHRAEITQTWWWKNKISAYFYCVRSHWSHIS